jgi:hypothetical protein
LKQASKPKILITQRSWLGGNITHLVLQVIKDKSRSFWQTETEHDSDNTSQKPDETLLPLLKEIIALITKDREISLNRSQKYHLP